MTKNFKILILSISILSFFFSCGSSKENLNQNIKTVETIGIQETIIPDSILESYRVQESSKNLEEVSFELLENPFDEKDNYIKVISSNQPSNTWKKCDTSSFYCSNFYFTKYLINFHPVFTDNNYNFLFFDGNEWVFCNQFPSKEIMGKIASNEIIIPNEDRICYSYNSFDPTTYSAWISDEMSYNIYTGDPNYKDKLTLGKEDSQVYKSLIWEKAYKGSYSSFEKQTTKNKLFKSLEENYQLLKSHNNLDDSSKFNFALVPDSNKYGDKYNKIEKILKSYLKANYPVELDSSNEININDEQQDRFGYIKFDSIIAGPINYVFNSQELEMEFDSEIKIIFPKCNHNLINNLLYCLDITLGDDEYGTCGEHKNKETYNGEWENLIIKDTNNQTVLIYSYSAAGC